MPLRCRQHLPPLLAALPSCPALWLPACAGVCSRLQRLRPGLLVPDQRAGCGCVALAPPWHPPGTPRSPCLSVVAGGAGCRAEGGPFPIPARLSPALIGRCSASPRSGQPGQVLGAVQATGQGGAAGPAGRRHRAVSHQCSWPAGLACMRRHAACHAACSSDCIHHELPSCSSFQRTVHMPVP